MLTAVELARVVELLAPASSHGRRRKGQLVAGRSRLDTGLRELIAALLPGAR